MRHLFFILLLNVPHMAGAAVSVPANNCESTEIQFSFSNERTSEKRGFFKRIAEKTLFKRLKKATARSGDGDGKWLAISGLILGVLAAFSFAFIYYTAFYLPLALSVGGLLLSILGLTKASGWQDTKLIRGLAIAGIVINAIALVGSIGLIGSF